jgi:hypothetical protein
MRIENEGVLNEGGDVTGRQRDALRTLQAILGTENGGLLKAGRRFQEGRRFTEMDRHILRRKKHGM